ncbi:hypothetical protein SAY87_022258 [Trapa incisa]|uniref:BHLH domain-containing protein n=2 Tax=Trapa TaxID=22665 RepID=A0AAN7MES4_TRANT|nr:hypothetical protein SAY87_022258 [Trapa incisa]KAK4803939.1 hypothetical protein SAY86_003756 [Trapa natans]
MDKINPHYDHFQDHLLVASSSSSSSSSAPQYSNLLFSSSGGEAISKEKDSSSTASTTNEVFHPMMAQNQLGFQWADLSSASDHDFPRTFTDMLINGGISSSSIGEDLHLRPLSSHTSVKNNDLSSELSQKLMLKTLTSRSRIEGGLHQFIMPGEDDQFRFPASSNNFISQIHPSINISSTNYQFSSSATISSSSLAGRNNWPTFDLLGNRRIRENDLNTTETGNFGSLLQDSLIPGLGLYHIKQASHRPESSSSFARISASSPNIFEGKRPSSFVGEPKALQVAPKKIRIESRSTSCPPLKVRKEKLGDRIATLQQLVAPFGKTDTASVLMEAIGYIKFLQNQVQTLSVPYMKSSRNHSTGASRRGSRSEGAHISSEESKQDLRSRGLCLVPLPCLSYITNDGGGSGGGGIWPPQDFGGGI